MPRPTLLFLYGPPAVGKLTIARAVAERSGFGLFDNHVSVDAVTTLLPFGSPGFSDVVGRFRVDVLRAACEQGTDAIFTFVYAKGDEPIVERLAATYDDNGGRAVFVRLTAPRDVLLQRVGNDSRRSRGKLVDAGELEQVFARHVLDTPIPGRDSLTLDTTQLEADAAAKRIVAHLDLPPD